MRIEYSKKNSDIINQQRNILFVSSCILFFIVFLQSIFLFKNDTKIILVPNNLKEDSFISSKAVSNEYIEAFSRDILNTFLNTTPENIEYIENSLLSLAHPRFYGIFKKEIEKIKTNIKEQKYSTAFYTLSLIPNSSNLSIIAEGYLKTFLGGKEISKIKKSYEIKFELISTKLYISSFKEIENLKK